MEAHLEESVIKFIERKVVPMLINGSWVAAKEGKTIPVINPATEKELTQIFQAEPVDVLQAIEGAHKAFHPKAPWRKISPRDRERIMHRIADLIEERKIALAQLITLENGKLFDQALSSDVMGAVHTFRYYAGWATKLEGQTVDLSLAQKGEGENFAFTRCEPVGVVAAIVPWNFPLSIAAWKIAPALAAGCTVVLKSSEETPLSALMMGEIMLEAGLPAGVLNIITGDGAVTGNALIQSPLIDKITFTGSIPTGITIGKAAMDQLTDVSLELGGKSPAIVFDDVVSYDAAIAGVAKGIFRNQGQVCVAGSRLYVHDTIYERFLTDLVVYVKKMGIGSGFDKGVEIGPLISYKHLEKVKNYISGATQQGARLLCGGQRPTKKGYYLSPAILATDDNHLDAVQEEIFGPVLMALPFKDLEEAIHLANDNVMGLAATVWTRDIGKALKMIDRLKAGMVFVNSPVRSDPNLPLGGYKQSGIGRELGKVGVYNYTTTKSVNIVY